MMKIAPYTFGVEIECFGVPSRSVAAEFDRVGLSVKDMDNWDGSRQYNASEWTIGDDGSIVGDCSMEIKSPILHGIEGLGALATAMDALVSMGVEVNETCGMHVHVGVTENADPAYNLSAAQIIEVLRQWSSHERESDLFIHPSRRGEVHNGETVGRNGYCRPVSTFMKTIEQALAPAMVGPEKPPAEYLRLVNDPMYAGPRYDYDRRSYLDSYRNQGWGNYHWKSDGRYHTTPEKVDLSKTRAKDLSRYGDHVTAVDLYSLGRYGTIEFRQHHGTVDAREACAWVRFVVNRLEQVRLGTASNNRSAVDGLEEEDILHFIDQADRFERLEKTQRSWNRNR
jgi:hypothetical protein